MRRVDRWMRWLHLYTGLFLFPWMLVYCASAFCLNHGPWMTGWLGVTPPKWEIVREADVPADTFRSGDTAAQARALLQYLRLDGAHNIQGPLNAGRMTVFRSSGAGNYRITWRRDKGKAVVERQQPFSWYRLLHFLHFRGGYGQPYPAAILWAVMVDAVTISIALWCVTGIYIWARRPRRLLGGLCVVAGSLLFIGLVIAFCQ
ncbi:MAG: PepSY-associated TM helix domain-containing protein [Thermoguttaceae bacterium]